MALVTTDMGAARVVVVESDRIDAARAIRFKDEMREAMGEDPDRIVLDLSKVAFIDSSGLGAIVASMKQLDPGRRLDLAGLTPTVDKVFRLTRMDTVFALYPSVEDALAAAGD
ncbi:MAG: anti-anti-sigma factor [Rhodobacteraceae bacterium]|nr:anti-anti-sigma factor [Paracoccaceae bacterium]MAY44390.1 anti-anti-sigma factor [Paracoccaceae bacterium]QEW18058.1 Putative anti-sigma factor antagonist [Marinibacterium anthonyi]|tara:strand:- start:226 stop:564 length:339 start_codon:yes stop_codon:yes gene_type:complete